MVGGESIARRHLVPLAVVVLSFIGGAALAGASTNEAADVAASPPGAPALDVMAVSAADLEPGASVQRQGYTNQPDFTLYYRREFKPGASLGRSKLLVLDSEVGMVETPDEASVAAASIETVLRSKKGRLALARAAVEDAGLSLTGMRVSSTGVRELAVRDAAFMFPLTVQLPHRVRVSVVLELVRVDRVTEVLYLVGQVNTRVVGAEAVHLLKVVANRMVAGLVPSSVTLPSIVGIPQVGLSVTADPGSWTNTPSSFAVQWLRCDGTGAGCAPIDGATSAGYVPVATDAGSTLEVSVIASNAVGSSRPALSPASAVVLAGAGP
jgi:hypothetical protein